MRCPALLFLGLQILQISSVHSEISLPLQSLAKPTLLLHPVRASVERGGSGDILIEAIPADGAEIRLTIKQPPSHGTLGDIKSASPNTFRITYTNNGDKDTEDEFTFRIRTSGKTWLTSRAFLSIEDPTDSLQISPRSLDFGRVGVGESFSKKLLLKNRLAGSLSGTLAIPSPWRVEGDDSYDLGFGESMNFTIVYEPHGVMDSYATVNLLSSGKGPSLTLHGESVVPFTVAPESVEILPGSAGPEVTVKNSMEHSIMLKAVTDDLVGVIPMVSLKPKGEMKVRLKDMQHPIKEMNTSVRFVMGGYETGVAVKILPLHPSTNDVLKATHSDQKPKLPKDRGIESADTARVTTVQLPTPTIDSPPVQIGTGLPQITTGPSLLSEEEQVKLRRLLISDLSYFLKPGWIAWNLTLQWSYDDLPPKEFLIEEKIMNSSENVAGRDLTGQEYRRIKPYWIRAQTHGIWQASVPSPPAGFRFIRIAPVLQDTDKTVWASFQIQMPSKHLIWEQYRGPFALLLLVILVVLVLRMMGRL
jgi:hypothetical protein